jgi:hypothetical protein
MMLPRYLITIIAVTAGMLLATAEAALPPPTPAQQQAAAAKKAQADAQAAQDKAKLAASMEAVAGRWRSRAAAQGWATHPAVAIAAPAAVPGVATPGVATPGVATPVAAALSTSATGDASAGQTAGQQAQQAAATPVRSEKSGTAAPSNDVKKRPTPAQPSGAPPTLVKKNTPQVHNQ